jgi:hypothetical protein
VPPQAGAPDRRYAGNKDADDIWIVGPDGGRLTTQLKYGDSFKAGYSSRAKEPWGFAQCWANDSTVVGTPNQGTYTPGDPVWSSYRSLTGLTGDSWLLADPIQGLWLGGGATCKLNLVSFVGNKQTVLASTDFTVVAS